MNYYSTAHGIVQIRISTKPLLDSYSSWTTKIELIDSEGSKVEITAFSERPILIEGAENVNDLAGSLIAKREPDAAELEALQIKALEKMAALDASMGDEP